MKILNVEPKDFHVTFDIPISEIDLILDALENTEIKFDADEKPDLKKAATFLTDVFFKNLNAVSEEVKRNK